MVTTLNRCQMALDLSDLTLYCLGHSRATSTARRSCFKITAAKLCHSGGFSRWRKAPAAQFKFLNWLARFTKAMFFNWIPINLNKKIKDLDMKSKRANKKRRHDVVMPNCELAGTEELPATAS